MLAFVVFGIYTKLILHFICSLIGMINAKYCIGLLYKLLLYLTGVTDQILVNNISVVLKSIVPRN